LDAKSGANGVLAKDSKIAAIQNYNSYLPSVMDFTLYEATTKVFNKKMKVGTRDDEIMTIFTNDFLYQTQTTF
jgi:hypothetical protein